MLRRVHCSELSRRLEFNLLLPLNSFGVSGSFTLVWTWVAAWKKKCILSNDGSGKE